MTSVEENVAWLLASRKIILFWPKRSRLIFWRNRSHFTSRLCSTQMTTMITHFGKISWLEKHELMQCKQRLERKSLFEMSRTCQNGFEMALEANWLQNTQHKQKVSPYYFEFFKKRNLARILSLRSRTSGSIWNYRMQRFSWWTCTVRAGTNVLGVLGEILKIELS